MNCITCNMASDKAPHPCGYLYPNSILMLDLDHIRGKGITGLCEHFVEIRDKEVLAKRLND